MNILTKNRILQKGDEYRNNGEWKPVPKDNYGLQIQFTTYKEVRRPSEKPISPDSETPRPKAAEIVTAKAGSDESPVASHSATGDASYLPTVVSKKAHKVVIHGLVGRRGPEIKKALGETPETSKDATTEQAKPPVSPAQFGLPPEERPEHPDTKRAKEAFVELKRMALEAEKAAGIAPTPETPTYDPTGPAPFPKGPIEKAADKVAAYSASNGLAKITFPKPDPTDLVAMTQQPIWTGRNGTFTGYGLEAMRVNNNVALSPIGKRGVGNCTIQIPLASIDGLMDWLKKQTPK